MDSFFRFSIGHLKCVVSLDVFRVIASKRQEMSTQEIKRQSTQNRMSYTGQYLKIQELECVVV